MIGEHYVMEDFLHDELSTSSQAADLELSSHESRAKRARLQENKLKTNVDAIVQDADARYFPTREIHVPPAAGGTATSVWTSESLYGQDAASGANKSTTPLYGNANDETCMRRWLDEHNLPQSVGDFLLDDIGARRIDDVVMVVEECESAELLARLKPLDRIKLKKAVEAYKQVEYLD